MSVQRVKDIRLADLVDRLPIPARVKAKYQEHYAEVYDYTVNNFVNRKLFKVSTVNKLNALLYFLETDGDVPYNWSDIVKNPEYSLDDDVDVNTVQRTVVPLYLSVDDILWDLQEVGTVGSYKVKHVIDQSDSTKDVVRYKVSSETPKENLFVSVPKYPKVGSFDPQYGNVHVSLPQIPTKQCEVSVTTRVESMSSDDLLKLYPRQFIRTRSPIMYEPREGITLDPQLGLLIPIDGFTDAQVRDSIIRYPHIFKLKRRGESGELQSFYDHIEVDGELLDTLKIWKYLPEARIIDIESLESRREQVEFIKEYVIRRYLLERDVKGVKHKYEVVGELPEFMTLFMPARMYVSEGYKDVVDLARTCVRARVSYLKSRNPRIDTDPTVKDCVFDSYCTFPLCDRSCPRWAQMDYLMMRNDLTSTSRPFQMKEEVLRKYVDVYESGVGTTTVVTSRDTIKDAEVMAYVSVCNNWEKSAMRVRAYHLVFSKYVDDLQSSWSGTKSDDLQYVELWSKSCNVLVVSGIDYVNFKDFQSQLILQLIQDREREGKTTFVVSPRVEQLTGSGKMFNLMVSKFKQIVRSFD